MSKFQKYLEMQKRESVPLNMDFNAELKAKIVEKLKNFPLILLPFEPKQEDLTWDYWKKLISEIK